MTPGAWRLPTTLAAAIALLATCWLLAYLFVDFDTILRLTVSVQSACASHPGLTAAGIIGLQAVSMLFSLPTKAAFNIVAGALLGLSVGIGATLFGVMLGATGLFFVTRRMKKNTSFIRIPRPLANIEQRIARRPIIAVASMRLMVLLPYGPVTIGCALTPISWRHFALGSIIGDLPVVALYALAGEHIMNLSRATDAISPTAIVVLMSAGLLLLGGVLVAPAASLQEARSESET